MSDKYKLEPHEEWCRICRERVGVTGDAVCGECAEKHPAAPYVSSEAVTDLALRLMAERALRYLNEQPVASHKRDYSEQSIDNFVDRFRSEARRQLKGAGNA